MGRSGTVTWGRGDKRDGRCGSSFELQARGGGEVLRRNAQWWRDSGGLDLGEWVERRVRKSGASV